MLILLVACARGSWRIFPQVSRTSSRSSQSRAGAGDVIDNGSNIVEFN
jgi:hypothetical protein